jgi:hypothetical protein
MEVGISMVRQEEEIKMMKIREENNKLPSEMIICIANPIELKY